MTKHVRSAVLHVNSLAQYVAVYLRRALRNRLSEIAPSTATSRAIGSDKTCKFGQSTVGQSSVLPKLFLLLVTLTQVQFYRGGIVPDRMCMSKALVANDEERVNKTKMEHFICTTCGTQFAETDQPCAGPPILARVFSGPKYVGVIDVMVVVSRSLGKTLETTCLAENHHESLFRSTVRSTFGPPCSMPPAHYAAVYS